MPCNDLWLASCYCQVLHQFVLVLMRLSTLVHFAHFKCQNKFKERKQENLAYQTKLASSLEDHIVNDKHTWVWLHSGSAFLLCSHLYSLFSPLFFISPPPIPLWTWLLCFSWGQSSPYSLYKTLHWSENCSVTYDFDNIDTVSDQIRVKMKIWQAWLSFSCIDRKLRLNYNRLYHFNTWCLTGWLAVMLHKHGPALPLKDHPGRWFNRLH